jgi:hypothetical protein
MDWNAAIDKNREALKRVLAMLVGMAGLAGAAAFTSPLWGGRREASGGGEDLPTTPTRPSDDGRPPLKGEVRASFTLPRHLHRAVLRLLRPAEAAARRLIVVAARGIVVALPPPRPRRPDPAAASAGLRRLGIAVVVSGRGDPRAANGRPAARPASVRPLPLVDRLCLPGSPRTRYVPAHKAPRILSLFGDTPPHHLPPPPGPDDPIDATRLNLRLQALASALDDLPGQALRLARWTARRRRASKQGRIGRTSPLKPGRAAVLPKSFRRGRPAHEVHDILRDLHGLARWALEKPDTS